MRRAAAAVLVAVAAGCAGIGAGKPGAAAPALGFRSEAAVLASVQRRLVALGYARAASATLVVEPDLVLAYYRAGVIHMRAVFADPADVDARLARLVTGIYGERADVFYAAAGSRADAVRAFRELGVLAIAHETFHHVRLAPAPTHAIDVFTEEDVAIQLELAFLEELVRDGRVDAGWRTRYRRLQRAFVTACAPDVIAGLPTAAGERHALFAAIADRSFAALGEIAAGRANPAPVLVQQRTAIYALRRLALVDAPPRRLADVARELLPR